MSSEEAEDTALSTRGQRNHAMHEQQQTQKTVLPSPIASLVSFGTATASLSLRIGGLVSGAAIQGARVASLTGFELGRAVIEGVLIRAGQDTVETSAGPIGRDVAEGLLERSLSTLHFSLTQTSFLINTGFQLGSATVTSSLALSQYALSAIDAILGDTETSKAVATIIVLIRREFQNPETGIPGEKVGLTDLLVGAIAFVLLQRWGAQRTEELFVERGVEEIVWNIVVLNEESARLESTSLPKRNFNAEHETDDPRQFGQRRPVSFISVDGSEAFDAMPNDDGASLISNVSSRPYDWGSEDVRSEQAFRHYLTQQLTSGTSVSVKAESITTNSITVELSGSDSGEIEPPPGYNIVAFEEYTGRNGPCRKFIFRRRKKRIRLGSFDIDEPATDHSIRDETDSQLRILAPSTPPVYEPSLESPDDHHQIDDSEMNRLGQEQESGYFQQANAISTNSLQTPTLANQKRQRVPPAASTSEKVAKKSSLKTSLARGTSYKNLVDFWNGEKRSHLRAGKSRGATTHTPMSQQPPDQSAVRVMGASTETYPVLTSSLANGTDGNSMSAAARERLVGNPRPASPTYNRRAEAIPRKFSSTDSGDTPFQNAWNAQRPKSRHSHRRSISSFNSLHAANSETSIVLQNRDAMNHIAGALYREGAIPGMFPRRHFLRNLSRFARFASASYGSSFLRFMGTVHNQEARPSPRNTWQVSEHHSFSTYTGLPSSTVLLSSFVDPQGGSNAKGQTDSGLPLVHYIVLDHDSKAVVLTCRGTLGFEDVLTDMTCDYDDILFRGKLYQVHKGMHASARRLLNAHSGRIIATIKAALEEFDDYGIVLCGHSLGGGVATLLALYLAQPNLIDPASSAFITSSEPRLQDATLALPPNRPIHVYAFGPPATISPYLRRATRGLITTVINKQDLVPYLSLGTLRDFQAIALAFKVDTNDAKGEVKRRVWDGVKSAFRDKTGMSALGTFGMPWSGPMDSGLDDDEEDHWPWVALKSLRASMLSEKLVPPGETFLVELQPVLQRYAFVEAGQKGADAEGEGNAAGPRSYRPANRATLRQIHDPEARFGELRFGASMFADHSPARYEKALAVLELGVCGIET